MSKVKRSEINKLAKQIAKTNFAILNAVHLTEELLHDELFKHINDEDNNETFIELIEAYRKQKYADELMATPETYGSYWQDYQDFANKFQEYIDNEV